MSFKCLYSGGDGAGDGEELSGPGRCPGLPSKASPGSRSFPGFQKWTRHRRPLPPPHSCSFTPVGLPCTPPTTAPSPPRSPPPHIKNNRTNYLEGPQELNCFQLLNTNHKSQKVVGFQKKEVPTGVCKAAREQTAVTKTTIKAQTLWPPNTGRPLPFVLKICLKANFHLFPLPFVLKIL